MSNLNKDEPDQLDLDCDAVFAALRPDMSAQDKIELLEQCIDYLRMEVY